MSILKDLKNRHKFILEAYEVVATYEFLLEGSASEPLKVKIMQGERGGSGLAF